LIEIEVVKKDVKNIILKVKPTGEVLVTTPMDCTEKEIEYVLKKRAEWIEQQVDFFAKHQFLEVKKEYVSGENFCYLGRNYRLKVIEDTKERVKLQRGYLHVFVNTKENYERKRALVQAWYQQKATLHFTKALEKYQPLVKREVKQIKIREMKTRWGSCNASKGYINLNLKLIEKHKESIEYVVLHELAHLVHPNHSTEFYNYLTQFMFDWKRRKERLG